MLISFLSRLLKPHLLLFLIQFFGGPDFDLLSFSGDPEFQRVFAALDELNLSDLKPLFKEKRVRVIITRH